MGGVLECLKRSGFARIARVRRFRRIHKPDSPMVRSLTCVRYRSGRIPSLKNDDRVSIEDDGEPYGWQKKQRRCLSYLYLHIYDVLITALYSP